MHVSKLHRFDDNGEIVAFIRHFSFGTIITMVNGRPEATHLPFSVEVRNERIVLSSHFNKANNHWQNIEQNVNLVIFSEPHAYISPKHYEHHPSVPTWNYIAVHCYGVATVVHGPEEKLKSLARLMEANEPEFIAHWESYPSEYRNTMLNGIVAFELAVTEMAASQKLSQNKSLKEQHVIAHHLADSENTNERLIAEYMRNRLTRE